MELTRNIQGVAETVPRREAMESGCGIESLAGSKLPVMEEECDMQPISNRLTAFRAWVASVPAGHPAADVSRDSIYTER